MDDILGVLWLASALALYYPTVHVMVHSTGEPDGSDWVFGLVLGAICALAWPVFVVALGAFMVSKRLWTGSWRLPWSKPIRATKENA